MPRNPGTGVYEQPAPDVITATTIESTVYNGFVNDVETDLNLPRPIVAGGTGATNATAARDNLDAERSAQVVTNYDTHVFEAGSFFSAPGATGEPVAGKYTSGICHFVNANVSMVLEAAVYDGTGPATLIGKYTRVKWTTWSTWIKQADEYVNVTGDTMTGNLIITKSDPAFGLQKLASGQAASVVGMLSPNKGRWDINLGDATTETGSGNAGSNFSIRRYTDAGTVIDTPLTILRTNGASTFTGNITINKSIPLFVLQPTDATNPSIVTQASSGQFSWVLTFGTTLVLERWNAAGGFLGNALQIDRTSGNAIFGAGLNLGNLPSASNPGISNTTVGIEMVHGSYIACSTASGGALFLNQNADGLITRFGRSGTGCGSITVTTTTTAFNTSSDERLKEDLKSFDAGNIVDDTNVYDFAWKATGERSYGVIAQQAKDIYPTATFHDQKEDRWFIDYSKYVPVILQELKALRARVAELEGKLEAGATPA